jgi:hypothetical protein
MFIAIGVVALRSGGGRDGYRVGGTYRDIRADGNPISTRPVAAARRTQSAAPLQAFRIRPRHELCVEAQHFFDVGGMRVEGLDQRFAGQDVRLAKHVEVMHDALTHPAFGVAQAHDGTRPDLSAWDAA